MKTTAYLVLTFIAAMLLMSTNCWLAEESEEATFVSLYEEGKVNQARETFINLSNEYNSAVEINTHGINGSRNPITMVINLWQICMDYAYQVSAALSHEADIVETNSTPEEIIQIAALALNNITKAEGLVEHYGIINMENKPWEVTAWEQNKKREERSKTSLLYYMIYILMKSNRKEDAQKLFNSHKDYIAIDHINLKLFSRILTENLNQPEWLDKISGEDTAEAQDTVYVKADEFVKRDMPSTSFIHGNAYNILLLIHDFFRGIANKDERVLNKLLSHKDGCYSGKEFMALFVELENQPPLSKLSNPALLFVIDSNSEITITKSPTYDNTYIIEIIDLLQKITANNEVVELIRVTKSYEVYQNEEGSFLINFYKIENK